MQESASFFQVLFNIVLWLFIYVVLKPAYMAPYTLKPAKRRLGFVLILLFCLYPFWGGDYFHYKEIFLDFQKGAGLSGQEDIYDWIFRTFGYSYTFLRLSIWGIALLILFWAYKRTCQSIDLTLFFFGVCFLPTFSYARVSLAMSLILLGLTFIVNKGKLPKIISIVFGGGFILCSALFHKSAPIGIVMALASLFLINASKKKIVFIVLLIPLLVVALQNALNYFSIMELDADTFITDRARSTYFETDSSGSTGIGALIGTILQQGPSYLVAVLYLITAWSGRTSLFTVPERTISAYAFCITMLSLGFSLDLGYSLSVLQYRTLFFAFPANAVFLAAVHRNRIENRLFKFIFYSTIIGVGYQFIYSTYLALFLH
ncbi:MAG: EpsG family protein [Bacteroidales bacterium]|nr:EpsG family protein [Bacteroidales bacterium]